MWEIVRKDAINALENRVVKKTIPKYVEKVKNKVLSNFQIAKRIGVDFDESFSLKKLWKIHEESLETFYQEKNFIKESDKINGKNLLDLKISIANKILESCTLCEWKCRVNRKKGQLGVCKVDDKIWVSSEFVHIGEESYFVPSHTIFFWSCNMYCVFCQNYTISHRLESGIEIEPNVLARIIEKRRESGTRNLNLVGGEPTMYLKGILEILKNVKCNVPVIWNSNMYMSEDSMKLLDGIVDVYLGDFKFGNDDCASKYTKVKNYWRTVTRNFLIGKNHAEIVIRHLVMPNHVECCSFKILEWISENLENALINIMDQYTPYWKAKDFEEINRTVTHKEFDTVIEKALELGLNVKG